MRMESWRRKFLTLRESLYKTSGIVLEINWWLTATEGNMTGTGVHATAEKVRAVHAAMAKLGLELDPEAPGDAKVRTPKETQ